MIKVFALALALLATPSLAQVRQTGAVTPGHPVMWTTNGIVQDAGTALAGFLTGLGVTASGPSICANSGPQSGAYNQICLGATQSGGGTISLTNFAGATGGLSFAVNGVTQGIPTVTLPVSVNDLACFSNTSGGIKDCSGNIGSLTLGSLTVTGSTALQGTVTASGLSTVGTIGGSLCATAAGLVLYESGVNCFTVAASAIQVGTTSIASGTNGRVEYNNGGVLGELATTGSGNVVLGTGPTIAGGALSGTFTGTPTFSGNLTFSGNPTFSGSVLHTGAVASLSGNGQASLGVTSANGAVLIGEGSANDVAIENKSGAIAANVATGTQTLTVNTLGVTNNTTLGGTLTAASLSTVGTVAGSLCATSGGLILYESAANCFAASGVVVTSGKTLTVTNSLTLSGTDGTTFTFPGTSDTLAGLGTAQTFTAFQTFSGGIAGSGTNVTSGPTTITSAQYFVCVAPSGSLQLNLPSTPVANESHLIKDCNGSDATNNITVNASGSTIPTIDAATTFVMKASVQATPPWQSIAVTYNSTYGWMIN